MHKKTNARPSWYFHGKYGCNVLVSLEHYRCQLIFAKDTNSVHVSDTVEFWHHCLTQPTRTHVDRIPYGINTLSYALIDAPMVARDAQLRAIIELRDLFQRWDAPSQFITVLLQPIHQKTHSGTLKLGKHGNQHKSCQPPTPLSPRVQDPAVAE